LAGRAESENAFVGNVTRFSRVLVRPIEFTNATRSDPPAYGLRLFRPVAVRSAFEFPDGRTPANGRRAISESGVLVSRPRTRFGFRIANDKTAARTDTSGRLWLCRQAKIARRRL